ADLARDVERFPDSPELQQLSARAWHLAGAFAFARAAYAKVWAGDATDLEVCVRYAESIAGCRDGAAPTAREILSAHAPAGAARRRSRGNVRGSAPSRRRARGES